MGSTKGGSSSSAAKRALEKEESPWRRCSKRSSAQEQNELRCAHTRTKRGWSPSAWIPKSTSARLHFHSGGPGKNRPCIRARLSAVPERSAARLKPCPDTRRPISEFRLSSPSTSTCDKHNTHLAKSRRAGRSRASSAY